MELITITIPKEDAVTLIKSLKVAKARKKLEANQHLRKNEIDSSNTKFLFIDKINELQEYLEYLIK